MGWMEEYEKLARLGGVKIPPYVIFGAAFLVVAISVLAGVVLGNFFLILLGLVVGDLIVTLPYIRGYQKVREIEENLPDALKQMASTLRSGGTYEVALREVVYSDYGELSKQFAHVLKDLESGMDLRRAFERLAGRVPSEDLRRMVTIMLDAIQMGGGLAGVLEDIAEDLRELNKIKTERKVRTAMQTIFIMLLSTVLGPFIFGAASGLMDYMAELGKEFSSKGLLSPENVESSLAGIHAIQGMILFYTIFQAVAAALIVSMIREGRPASGLRNAAFYMFFAYVFLFVGKTLVITLLGS